ncbi:unnamed protein product, partial [Scytosiphon promiscuus]
MRHFFCLFSIFFYAQRSCSTRVLMYTKEKAGERKWGGVPRDPCLLRRINRSGLEIVHADLRWRKYLRKISICAAVGRGYLRLAAEKHFGPHFSRRRRRKILRVLGSPEAKKIFGGSFFH